MIGIPDEPTDADIKRLLAHVVCGYTGRGKQTNQEECARFRGTSGEPVPIVEMRFTFDWRWKDALSFEALRQEQLATGGYFVTAEQLCS